MTLLVTILAAVAATAVWYLKDGQNQMKTGTLSLIYWGASLMWTADAIAEYIELRAAFFTASAADVMNDLALGICVVALGLVIWILLLLISDPKKVIRKRN